MVCLGRSSAYERTLPGAFSRDPLMEAWDSDSTNSTASIHILSCTIALIDQISLLQTKVQRARTPVCSCPNRRALRHATTRLAWPAHAHSSSIVTREERPGSKHQTDAHLRNRSSHFISVPVQQCCSVHQLLHCDFYVLSACQSTMLATSPSG